MQSDLEGSSPEQRDEAYNSPQPSKHDRKRSLDTAELNSGDVGDQSPISPSNQLVLYNGGQDDIAVSDHMENHTPTLKNFLGAGSSGRALPSIGAFTVQCATCFKWRLIPTKEKYEEIREHILEEPFVCEQAREWRPDISCEDPTDISQDGSRLWAIDKPNIAQPPPGWERILRIRGEGGTKFADVYYAAPSGKRLRSMVEVQRYLLEHPEYVREGVNLSQFSFQIPRPLQENYVRKRPARLTSSIDGGGLGLPAPPESEEVNPLCWAAPPMRSELEVGMLNSAAPCEGQGYLPPSKSLPVPATRRKARRPSFKQIHKKSIYDQLNIRLEDAEQSRINPLCWTAPSTFSELQVGVLDSSAPSYKARGYIPPSEPLPLLATQRKATRPSSKQMYNNPMYDQLNIKHEDAEQARNTSFDL